MGLGRGIGGLGADPTYATADLQNKSNNLKALQTALIALSDATRNPAINPGAATGVLSSGLPDDKTMGAVVAAMALISPHLPTWAAVTISVGLGVGASTTTAKQAVIDNAKYLTDAVKAATITAPFYTKPDAPAATTTPSIFATTGPWYKTWWGVGAIATAMVGTLALVAAHRRAPAPAQVSGHRRR